MRAELNRGADLTATGYNGFTALHWATAYGAVPIIRLLLENGADATAKTDFGTQVMHFAASSGPEVIRLLLEYGSDIDATDDEGRTALHATVASAANAHQYQGELSAKGIDVAASHAAGIRSLLEHGADPSAKGRLR